MKKTALFLLFLLCSLYSFAIAYNDVWQKANASYQQKDYEKAAALYEQLAELKPDNAEVYYNLGNTYYRLNRVGLAVLNYERALKIEPDHRAAQDNLELTESRIPNRVQEAQDIFFVQWWKSITGPQLAQTWAIVGLILFLLSLAILTLLRLQRGPGWLKSQMAIVGFALCALFVLFGYTAGNRKASSARAVVLTHDAPLAEQGGKGKGQSVVPEGTVVRISSEKSGMLEVSLPDGRKGWMNKELLERI